MRDEQLNGLKTNDLNIINDLKRLGQLIFKSVSLGGHQSFIHKPYT